MSSRTMVVAFDGSDVGEDALALGAWLSRATGDTALVVDVHPEEPVSVLPGIGSDWVREMRANADEVLAGARALVGDGVRAEYRPVAASSVARGVDKVATEVGADLIILGSSHRGVRRRIGVGKTADRLLHGSAVPVLMAPRGSRDEQLTGPEVIGCAYVPTPDGEQALLRAADLALRSGARLKIFTVVAHGVEIRDTDRERQTTIAAKARLGLEEAAQKAMSLLPEGLSAEVEMLEGGVVDSLAALDLSDCQVLVCGSRGYGPVGRVLLGGVSGRLVRKAMCPVMVVPRCPVEEA